MTALTAEYPRQFSDGVLNEFPVYTGVKIYRGAAVGLVSGGNYARQWVAGDTFAGFCEKTIDNTNGSSGDVNVVVRAEGKVMLPVTGVAAGDEGKPVYASNCATFDLTSATLAAIGRVFKVATEVDTTGYAYVDVDTFATGTTSGITSLTDSTGGTSPGNTLSAITLPETTSDGTGGTSAAPTLAAITLPETIQDNTTGTSAAPTLAAIATPASVVDSTSGVAGVTLAAFGATLWSDDVTICRNSIARLAICANGAATGISSLKNSVAGLAAQCNTQRTASNAMRNAIAGLAAQQNTTRTALNVVRNDLAGLAAKVNELLAALG